MALHKHAECLTPQVRSTKYAPAEVEVRPARTELM